jgi:hypothetical protein
MATAKAKVAGAGAMLRPVSSGTQVRIKYKKYPYKLNIELETLKFCE